MQSTKKNPNPLATANYGEAISHPGLKEPIWRNAADCFDYLQGLDKQQDKGAHNELRKWIGKILELASGHVEAIFNEVSDLPNAVHELVNATQPSGKAKEAILTGNAPGSPNAYEAFIAEPAVREKIDDKVLEKGLEEMTEKVKKAAEKPGRWSPLANAIYKIGKKFCITILPILLKGAALTAALSSLAVVAGGQLFLLGVIITYDVEEERVLRAEKNAQLSVRLIGHLNRCRLRAISHLEKQKHSAHRLEQTDEYEDTCRFVEKRAGGLSVYGRDVETTAMMLEANLKRRGRTVQTHDGTTVAFRSHFRESVELRDKIMLNPKAKSQDKLRVEIEINLIWVFMFLLTRFGIRGQSWPANFGAAEVVKLEEVELDEILAIFGTIPEESVSSHIPQSSISMGKIVYKQLGPALVPTSSPLEKDSTRHITKASLDG